MHNDKHNHIKPQDPNILSSGQLERENDTKKATTATQKEAGKLKLTG